MAEDTLLDFTALIVANHVTNNNVSVGDVPGLIKSVHDALQGLGKVEPAPEVKQEPAVSIRASVKPDYIVSLESGKKMKMLKRYLMTNYSMTPDDYRRKWGLAADYPMVAPNYAAQRKELALKIGLGRKPSAVPVAKPATAAAPAPAPKKVATKAAKPLAGPNDKSGVKKAPTKAKAKPKLAPVAE